MSLTTNLPARPRRFRRFAAPLLAVLAVFTPTALVGRQALIHRMRLPRLTVDQGGDVIAVAITPDGKTLFTGNAPDALHVSWDKPADIFVWESASGRLVRRLPGFDWRSNAVTVSPDGNSVIASGSTNPDVGSVPEHHSTESIVSWDWKTSRKLWAVNGSMPLSYSPDGRLIGADDGIHEAATGRLIVRIPNGLPSDGQIEFSPDGKLFGFIGAPTLDKNGLTDSDNGGKRYYSTMRLHLWHTATGKEARDFPFTRVRAFDLSRDGKWLVIAADPDGARGGTDGSVLRRVDLETGAVPWTRERTYNAPLHDPDAVLNSIIISPNGKYVIAQSTNSQLIVLDAGTGHELFRPFSHQANGEPSWALPGGLAFSEDGRTLVSRCGRKALVWDASSLL